VRVIITGGAGFVGSHLAGALQSRPGNSVFVLDNLRRRGSELNLAPFKMNGIGFLHGDIREMDDLWDVPGNFDLMIEASAEPSVHAGEHGSPAYVIGTNLRGTLNCLEFARRRAGSFLFLSTSRVYFNLVAAEHRLGRSPATLRDCSAADSPRRFGIGISEDFPTNQARSFYGATKLASELLIQEYVSNVRTQSNGQSLWGQLAESQDCS